jgi:hypothetical protein
MITEEDLRDYTEWLIKVWNPNQLYIPFAEQAPKVYLNANKISKDSKIEVNKRRLNRLTEQKDVLEKDHKGNEDKYSYWGGWSLGYLKGKISEIEDIIK